MGIEKRQGAQSKLSEEEKVAARKQFDSIIEGEVEGMVMLITETDAPVDGETDVKGMFFCNGIDEQTRARVGLQGLNIPAEIILSWGFKLLMKQGD